MGYIINLISTNKRTNSTAAPSGGQAIQNARLEPGESTIIHPVFRFNIKNQQGNPVELGSLDRFNYMIWSGNLYWIDNIKSITNDVVEIIATRDPFGTFSTAIKSSTCYITRISQANKISYYDDDNVIDATNVNNGVAKLSISTGFSFTDPAVSIVTYGADGVSYNIFDDDVQNISNALFDNVSDLWDAVYQKLTSPAQYVKSCLLLPSKFDFNYSLGTVIKLGNAPAVNIGNGMNVTDATRYKEVTFSTTCNSIAALSPFYANPGETFDYRLVNSQFSKVDFLVPFVGKISCPLEVLTLGGKVFFDYNVDVVTGQGECLIYATKVQSDSAMPYIIISKTAINMGASVPMTTSYDNRASILQNIFSPAQMFSSVLNPRQDINMIGNIDGVGYANIGNIEICVSGCHSDDLSYTIEKGRPCNQRLLLSSLTRGTYVECLNPSVSITGAIKDEIDLINNTLKGGMYIE